ncbi:DUF4870 domain-containing protein [Ornithinimicrobium panacihumi]|uniref:DUF4870 domain-containing protein n=1 Tax=Ornithinimicrobium panacihumi TaxID=2008449 RepID=UPI003F89FD9D
MTQPHDPNRTYGHEPQQPYQQGAYPQQSYQQGAPQGPGYQPAYGAPQGGASGEERTMMLLAHLSAPIAFLVSAGSLPFLGPLLIWFFYKDRSPAVRKASAGAFNFNVGVTIATWITWASVFLTLFVGLIWAIPILIFLFILQIWAHLRGVIKASDGQAYDYPFQIRILS